MGEIESLREREKELRCLYQVQHLTLNSTLPVEEVLQQVADALPAGWQRPLTTSASIDYLGELYQSPDFEAGAPRLVQQFELAGQVIGEVVVADTGMGLEADPDEVFLPEELHLLKSIASLLSNFLQWRHLEVLGRRVSPEAPSVRENESAGAEAMVKRTLLGLSHELRNPLTVIVADVDLLRRELPAETRDEVISEIQRAASGMSALIADLMLFLRAETGVEKPVLEEVEISPFVASVLERYKDDAGVKLAFVSEATQTTPLRVNLNREMTERILRDLIRNGILYSHADQIQISVKESPTDGVVVVSVKDEGRGIDKEHQDKIFEQFYRLESSRDRFTGGVGLGLPLARALARIQSCRLELISEPGLGTEVQLIFNRL